MTGSEQDLGENAAGQGAGAQWDPMALYFAHVEDSTGDADDLEMLGVDHAVTIHSISGARFLARATADLGAALASKPHSLLLAEDAATVVSCLAEQLRGAAAVATGVGAWLTLAHARGEVGDPAEAVAALTGLARGIEAAASEAAAVALPEDTAEPFDRRELAERVTAELRQRGVQVADPEVGHSHIEWTLPEQQTLAVDDDGWRLVAPAVGSGRRRVLMDPSLPGLPYAHPAQVAAIVAASRTELARPAGQAAP
ncbi:hypothetical protein [Catellatospora sp. NPDC049133]|uniref:hypothetical protein n=1 Tax=Catellatospora sp. NPDC049133 TaxID=3155499 RepID=UPI0033F8C593